MTLHPQRRTNSIQAGDSVLHPNYGTGIVQQASPRSGEVRVLFDRSKIERTVRRRTLSNLTNPGKKTFIHH